MCLDYSEHAWVQVLRPQLKFELAVAEGRHNANYTMLQPGVDTYLPLHLHLWIANHNADHLMYRRACSHADSNTQPSMLPNIAHDKQS